MLNEKLNEVLMRKKNKKKADELNEKKNVALEWE